MEEIHIEYGMPTVDVAMPLLTEQLRTLKKSGVKAVKVIHGYGSTGKGGRLRKATIALLDELKKGGLIREFVGGEQWSKCEVRTMTLIDRSCSRTRISNAQTVESQLYSYDRHLGNAIAKRLTFGNVESPGATMYHSAFTRRSNRGLQTVLPSLQT